MSRQQSTDGDDESGSRRDQFLERRKFLMATGALAGVGVLAGCGGGGGGGTTTGEPTDTSTPEPTTEPTDTATPTPEGSTEQEPSLEEKYPGLEILSPEPENAQAAARSTYAGYLTPNEEFYIRNHYVSPDIDESEWTVSLTGLVDQDVDISMAELKGEYGTDSVTHTMQCSGNGRSYFEPQVGGNQWSFGAVGNTVWTGTPVSEILERYGADTSEGRYLTVMGGDAPDGEDIFTRSIPMSKVMDDVLLAYEMNGSPLPKEHGFPVRLLVPGWFGNNNVKWVNRMNVMSRMVNGPQWEDGDQRLYTHWQQYSYRIAPRGLDHAQFNDTIPVFDTQDQMESDAVTHPYLYDQLVKSLIGYPGEGQTVSRRVDGTIEVVGVAWAGDDAVETVEVSTDGGQSWNEAEFFGPVDSPNGWRQFRYVWNASPGDHTLVSRATDENGRTQPETISGPDAQASQQARIMNNQFPWNEGGYGNNAYMPHAIDCTVQQ